MTGRNRNAVVPAAYGHVRTLKKEYKMKKPRDQFRDGVVKVREYCKIKNLDKIKDNKKLRCESKGKTITIFDGLINLDEIIKYFSPNEKCKKLECPMAQIRFNKEKGNWSLYWDGFGHWILYSELKPTKSIERIIKEINSDRACKKFCVNDV